MTHLYKNQLGGLCLVAFSLVYGWQTLAIPVLPQFADAFNARSLPTALAVLGFMIGLLLVCRRTDTSGYEHLHWRRGLVFIVLMSAYGLSLRPAGFLLSTCIFLAAGFVTLGERRLLPITLIAVGVSLGFWLLMTQVMGIYIKPWPRGI